MKVIITAVLSFFAVIMVLARRRDCTNDVMACKPSECCVLNFAGNGKMCKRIGHAVGELCGGEYFCPDCACGLICTPVIVTDNITRPANGTCQVPVEIVEPEVIAEQETIIDEEPTCPAHLPPVA